MKAPNLHLNLLHVSERQSSSPVRLRVMLPIFAALACAGCLLWWGTLKGRLMLVKRDTAAIQKDIDAINPKYAGVTNDLNAVNEMRCGLDQLSMYTNACHKYGGFLVNVVSVSEDVSSELKLLQVEIPEPKPQVLRIPGAKPGQWVELPGPTNPVENVEFQIYGLAPDEKPVKALMEAFTGPDFANTLIGVENKTGVYNDQQRAFTIKYRCVERRFGK